MVHDELLAERVRALLARRRGIEEKPMFGGLAFLSGGKMLCSVKETELLVRVGAQGHEQAVARPRVRAMMKGGKPAVGYVYVRKEALAGDAALREWVEIGLAEAKAASGGARR